MILFVLGMLEKTNDNLSFSLYCTITEHFQKKKLQGCDSFAWCVFLEVHGETWLWKAFQRWLKAILTLSRK